MPPRILFITTTLSVGGAEKQLSRLLSRLHGSVIEAGVVSLLSRGPVRSEIERLGVQVWDLGLENPLRLPLALPRLAAIVRRFPPNVLQGWMYHGNLAALWAKYWVSNACLIFGIRHSLYDLRREKSLTRQVIRWNAAASHRVCAIVYNSETAQAQHKTFGFDREKGVVIPNGFDTNLFYPDESYRQSVRKELGIPLDAPLIGFMARYHPIKGHDIFLQAAELLAARRSDVHFVLAGHGVTGDRPPFSECARRPLLRDRLHLLGERMDMPRLTAALDIASSSSLGEAFPNVIGEAMSCCVPCVATDVGDVRNIIGETGVVVPPGDARALSAGWEKMLALSSVQRAALGRRARRRVVSKFGLDAMANQYAALYRRVIRSYLKNASAGS